MAWGKPPYTWPSLAGIAVAVVLIMGVERVVENGWVRVLIYVGILLGLELKDRLISPRS